MRIPSRPNTLTFKWWTYDSGCHVLVGCALCCQVLENRRGIPITLALLYTSIASRCGLPMVGIGLPGCDSIWD